MPASPPWRRGDRCLECLDGLGLVILYCDHHVVDAQHVPDRAGAIHDIAGMFDAFSVVDRNIRLAFGRVDQQSVDVLSVGDIQLYVGGKAGPAQPGQPAGAHSGNQVGPGVELGRVNPFPQDHFTIRFNFHRGALAAVGEHDLGQPAYLAGDAGVHRRRHGGVTIPHYLAYLDGIPHLHGGNAGNANVLQHGQYHPLGRRHAHDGAVGGVCMVG